MKVVSSYATEGVKHAVSKFREVVSMNIVMKKRKEGNNQARPERLKKGS